MPYVYGIEKFQRAYEDGKIILPDGLIVLEPQSDQIFLKRVQERGRVNIDFLNELKTLHIMHDWYLKNISKVYPESGLILQTIEGDVDLTAKFVFEFVSSLDDKELKQLGLTPLLDT